MSVCFVPIQTAPKEHWPTNSEFGWVHLGAYSSNKTELCKDGHEWRVHQDCVAYCPKCDQCMQRAGQKYEGFEDA